MKARRNKTIGHRRSRRKLKEKRRIMSDKRNLKDGTNHKVIE